MFKNKKEVFSIRKTKLAVGSVCIGLLFIGGEVNNILPIFPEINTIVHADDVSSKVSLSFDSNSKSLKIHLADNVTFENGDSFVLHTNYLEDIARVSSKLFSYSILDKATNQEVAKISTHQIAKEIVLDNNVINNLSKEAEKEKIYEFIKNKYQNNRQEHTITITNANLINQLNRNRILELPLNREVLDGIDFGKISVNNKPWEYTKEIADYLNSKNISIPLKFGIKNLTQEINTNLPITLNFNEPTFPLIENRRYGSVSITQNSSSLPNTFTYHKLFYYWHLENSFELEVYTADISENTNLSDYKFVFTKLQDNEITKNAFNEVRRILDKSEPNQHIEYLNNNKNLVRKKDPIIVPDNLLNVNIPFTKISNNSIEVNGRHIIDSANEDIFQNIIYTRFKYLDIDKSKLISPFLKNDSQEITDEIISEVINKFDLVVDVSNPNYMLLKSKTPYAREELYFKNQLGHTRDVYLNFKLYYKPNTKPNNLFYGDSDFATIKIRYEDTSGNKIKDDETILNNVKWNTTYAIDPSEKQVNGYTYKNVKENSAPLFDIARSGERIVTLVFDKNKVDPTLKGNLSIPEKTQITNEMVIERVNVPQGSTAKVISPLPNTNTDGNKGTVTVEISYTDNTKATIQVPVIVTDIADNLEKEPTLKGNLSIPEKSTITNEQVIERVNVPEGGIAKVISPLPDTTTDGNKGTVTVEITYTDNTKDTIQVPVVVTDIADNQEKEPTLKGNLSILEKSKITNEQVIERVNVPQGGAAKVISPLPNTDTDGNKGTVTVEITYTDSTKDTIQVPIIVTDIADNLEKEPTLKGGLTVPEKSTITNEQVIERVNVPEGGTAKVVSQLPNTDTEGNKGNVTVEITYTDNTKDTIQVPIVVTDIADNQEKEPTLKGNLSIPEKSTITNEQVIERVNVPEGGTAKVVSPLPDTTTDGNKGTVTVEITYTDNTKDTIQVPIVVTDIPNNLEYPITNITNTKNPIELDFHEHPTLEEFEGLIETAIKTHQPKLVDDSIGFDVNVLTKYPFAQEGKHTVDAEVIFDDKSKTDIQVEVNVTKRPENVVFEPTLKGNLSIPEKSTLTNEQVIERVNIPNNGTAKVVSPLPDITTDGNKGTVTVEITYSDNTKDTIQVPVIVTDINDNLEKEPTLKSPLVVPERSTITNEQVIERVNVPEGGTAKVVSNIPDITTDGNKGTVTVEITYTDNSKDTIQVPIVATDIADNLENEPTLKRTFEIPELSTVTNEQVFERINIPTGGTPKVISPLPNTIEGLKGKITVEITYPDGTKDTIDVPYIVVDVPNNIEHKIDIPSLDTDAIEINITNLPDLPEFEEIIERAIITQQPKLFDDSIGFNVNILSEYPFTTLGEQIVKTEVVFDDNSKQNLDVLVNVVEKTSTPKNGPTIKNEKPTQLVSSLFTPSIETIYVNVNDNLLDELITNKLTGISKNSTYKVLSKPSTDKVGEFEATVEITYEDNSKEIVKSKIIVKEQTSKPQDNITISNEKLEIPFKDLYKPTVDITEITIDKTTVLTNKDLIDLISKDIIKQIPGKFDDSTPFEISILNEIPNGKVGEHLISANVIFKDTSSEEITIKLVIKEQSSTPKEGIPVLTQTINDLEISKVVSPEVNLVKVPLGTEITENVISKGISLKDGINRKLKLVNKPNIVNPGEYEFEVEIEYDDKSKEIVNVPVLITEPAPTISLKELPINELFTPKGSTLTVDKDSIITEEILVNKVSGLPKEYSVKVVKDVPTTEAGNFKAELEFTYPDNSKDLVTIDITVVEKSNTPKEGTPYETLEKPSIPISEIVNPEGDKLVIEQGNSYTEEDLFKTIKGIPENTKYEIKVISEKPSTDKPGEYEVEIEITYEDGSKDTIVTKVEVTPKKIVEIKEVSKVEQPKQEVQQETPKVVEVKETPDTSATTSIFGLISSITGLSLLGSIKKKRK